jgi:hypothetical protein
MKSHTETAQHVMSCPPMTRKLKAQYHHTQRGAKKVWAQLHWLRQTKGVLSNHKSWPCPSLCNRTIHLAGLAAPGPAAPSPAAPGPGALGPAAPGATAGGVAPPARARPGLVDVLADILVVMPHTNAVHVVVTVMHPTAESFVVAAVATPGAAAAARDRHKANHYLHRGFDCSFALVPFSMQTYGCLGEPAMRFLSTLAVTAAAGGRVSQSAFLEGALRLISDALCNGNGRILCYDCYSLRSGRNIAQEKTNIIFPAIGDRRADAATSALAT